MEVGVGVGKEREWKGRYSTTAAVSGHPGPTAIARVCCRNRHRRFFARIGGHAFLEGLRPYTALSKHNCVHDFVICIKVYIYIL